MHKALGPTPLGFSALNPPVPKRYALTITNNIIIIKKNNNKIIIIIK